MPYIGKEPEHGNYQRIDTIASSFNGNLTTFNLRADSLSVYPTSPSTMIISLGGVIQEPNTSFTVTGDQITFTTAPATGTTFWGVSLGDTLDIGTPSDGSVTVAKMADDSVDSAELVAGSVDLAHMSVNSIDSDQYVNASIDLAHMSVDSIDSDQYVDGSIDRVHLAADIVDGTKIADDVIDSEHYVAASIDNEHLADGAVDTEEIADDAVTTDKLANSINTEITANTAKVTNATHTGDVTGGTALTLATGAVDIAHLSASGTKDGTTVLHGNNTFAAVSGIPSGAIIMWHGLIANIPGGWVLCNGSNSTPDLRGKFVQGAANGLEANNPVAGGSATATPGNHSNHSVTQPSNHSVTQPSNHSVTQPSGHSALSAHSHNVPFGIHQGNYGVYDLTEYGTGSGFSANELLGGNSYSQNTSVTAMLSSSVAAGTPSGHSGTAVNAHSSTAVDAHSSTAVDAHSAHSTSDSRPPFYTILYIMKS
jgi:hypothetical protein